MKKIRHIEKEYKPIFALAVIVIAVVVGLVLVTGFLTPVTLREEYVLDENGTVKGYYLYNENGNMVEEYVASEDGSAMEYYVYDDEGNVLEYGNASGFYDGEGNLVGDATAWEERAMLRAFRRAERLCNSRGGSWTCDPADSINVSECQCIFAKPSYTASFAYLQKTCTEAGGSWTCDPECSCVIEGDAWKKVPKSPWPKESKVLRAKTRFERLCTKTGGNVSCDPSGSIVAEDCTCECDPPSIVWIDGKGCVNVEEKCTAAGAAWTCDPDDPDECMCNCSTPEKPYYIFNLDSGCVHLQDACLGTGGKLTCDSDRDPDVVLSYDFDTIIDSIVIDNSIYGNDGTIYGTKLKKGKYGNALQFDGVDDYIDCGDDSSLDIRDAITIEGWFRSTRPAADKDAGVMQALIGRDKYRDWVSCDYYSKDQYLYCYIEDMIVENDIGFFNLPTAVGRWYHFAMTYDKNGGADNAKIYVNGKLQKTLTKTGSIGPPDPNSKLLIGMITYFPGHIPPIPLPFEGQIDKIRLWKRALTASEIKNQYKFSDCGCSCPAGKVWVETPTFVGCMEPETTCKSTGVNENTCKDDLEAYATKVFDVSENTSVYLMLGEDFENLELRIVEEDEPSDTNIPLLEGAIKYIRIEAPGLDNSKIAQVFLVEYMNNLSAGCNHPVWFYYNETSGSWEYLDTEIEDIGFGWSTVYAISDHLSYHAMVEGGECCGDGIINYGIGEECEPGDLGGLTCGDYGYDTGDLKCNTECRYDTSGCRDIPRCGNGKVEGNEECDNPDNFEYCNPDCTLNCSHNVTTRCWDRESLLLCNVSICDIWCPYFIFDFNITKAGENPSEIVWSQCTRSFSFDNVMGHVYGPVSYDHAKPNAGPGVHLTQETYEGIVPVKCGFVNDQDCLFYNLGKIMALPRYTEPYHEDIMEGMEKYPSILSECNGCGYYTDDYGNSYCKNEYDPAQYIYQYDHFRGDIIPSGGIYGTGGSYVIDSCYWCPDGPGGVCKWAS